MENITITDFAAKNIDDILNIQAETGLSVWSKNDYLGELEREDSIFKIAQTADEKIIGFALVRLLIGNFDASNLSFDSSEILNIAVLNSFQKQGVGQMIYDEILLALKEKNIKEIWLEVRASNEKAIWFYQKNGFEMQFERKNYYQNPSENAIIFRSLIGC
ncbi:MAG TPA: ribosomal protein S18-alanine N-acetyltransferase [Pyrinomonadaceae bacterium]|nr:ribosomal protein S18-alanine N-acetyltransferase [Pyrinomonadaceae bacterium]